MKRLFFASTLLLLSSCGSEATSFPALPPTNRIKIETYDLEKNFDKPFIKSITDAQKIATIVAIIDAESSNWHNSREDSRVMAPTSFTGIELNVYSGTNKSCRWTIPPKEFTDLDGKKANIWAWDKRQNPDGAWVIKQISPTQMKALLDAIGPVQGDINSSFE